MLKRTTISLALLAAAGLLLAGCTADNPNEIKTFPAIPPSPTAIAPTPTAADTASVSPKPLISSVTPTKVSSTTVPGGTTADLNQVVAVLSNWPKNPWAALSAKGKQEYPSQTKIVQQIPPTTVIVPDRATWQPDQAGTSGTIIAKTTFANGRSDNYEYDLSKINGTWKIDLTIWSGN